MQKRIMHLFGGLLGRHKIADDIISTLVKVQFCRTRQLNETVGELVTLIKAGILVEDVEKELRNFTWNERKPFHDYVTNATEELDNRLAAQLKKCRQLKEVKPQMRRILDDQADEDPSEALDQVFNYLSDRYDQHHWFLLTYDAREEGGISYDRAFYEAQTTMGMNHKVAALPVAHRQLKGDDHNQAWNFLINPFCRRNDSRIVSYNHKWGMNEFLASNGFHYAAFPMSKVLRTHSPDMDLAHWPYHKESCQLGVDGSYLFAIAPPYKIPADHIPTNRSMALISTYHGGALTASSPEPSKLEFAPYTGQPGQRWKLIDGSLQNDLGMCAKYQTGVLWLFSNRLNGSFHQFPCDGYGTKHVWHLNTDHDLFRSCEFEEVQEVANKCPEYPLGYDPWYFSEDGKRPFEKNKDMLPMDRVMGRPLVHVRSRLVLTVQHNDPTSAMLVLDKDKGWSGQRWRFEGTRLINDLNNCLMTGTRSEDKVLAQLPCPRKTLTEYYDIRAWSFQDGYIRNPLNGWCVGSETERSGLGDPVILRDCSDSAAASLQWTMEDYAGPLPPRPAAPTQPASRALINGFGLALSVKDDVEEWQWVIQETYRGLNGQRWFLQEGRLHNDLGKCLYSSYYNWALQDICYKGFGKLNWEFFSGLWHRTEWNQLKSRYGCLGVHKNVNAKRSWKNATLASWDKYGHWKT